MNLLTKASEQYLKQN